MKITNSYKLLSLLALSMTAPANAALMNYVITGYAAGSSAIFNTSTDVYDARPDGPNNASGGPTNSVLRAPGAFVDFTIGDATPLNGTPSNLQTPTMINALPTVAILRVTLDAISGNGLAGGSEVMIARTSNSQTLTDVGTLTLLVTGTGGSNSNSISNSATFRFDWRNTDNDGPLAVGSNQMIFSSYDIDFTQRNRIPDSDIAAIGVSSSPTSELSVTSSLGVTTIVDPPTGSASTTTNPTNAYAFVTNIGDTSQSISVDKAGGGVVSEGYGTGGNQLYMFSFRSPSPLLPNFVPEPSSAVLAGLGALALLRRRRA